LVSAWAFILYYSDWMELHLELCAASGWRTVATLQAELTTAGVACTVSYDLDYAIERMLEAGEGERGIAALACAYPVRMEPYHRTHLPAFLDDIRPGGGAQRWWTDRLGIARLPPYEQSLHLLRSAAIAPVGHLRIAEAVPARMGPPPRFALHDVLTRNHTFLDYAAEAGASVGGATGAGGEAPKLLLRVSADEEVWIDTWQDEDPPDPPYLVKFARHPNSPVDADILRAEYVYYRALAALGFETMDPARMWLMEGPRGPSLWLPRFDVVRLKGGELRLGMESLYSLTDAPPGSWQAHQTYVAALHGLLQASPEDAEALVGAYLERDLLNVVFGNSDNHGRNTAILKTLSGIKLAPIFDFAPMKLDPEGIVRTTRWHAHEHGSLIDWPGVCKALAPYGRPAAFMERLHLLAHRLRDLPDRLEALGLAPEVLHAPALGLTQTAERLKRWGLLP